MSGRKKVIRWMPCIKKEIFKYLIRITYVVLAIVFCCFQFLAVSGIYYKIDILIEKLYLAMAPVQ